MFDPNYSLISRRLGDLSDSLAADPTNAQAWTDASQTLGAARATEPELAAAIDAHDAAKLQAIVAEWRAGTRLLPELDRQLLQRAIKAFKKRLKVTRLDAESGIGGGAMSSGKKSGIVGITPPREYGSEVWEELVKRGRLIGRSGIYELNPETPGAPPL